MQNTRSKHLSHRPHQFDPHTLSRSVIALPLLEKIDTELDVTSRILAEHPAVRDKYNRAVFLNPDFPGGVAGALKAARARLEEASEKVGAPLVSIDEPDPAISETVALATMDDATARQLLGIDASEKCNALIGMWPSRFEVIIDINLSFLPPPKTNRSSVRRDPELDHPDPRRVAKALIKQYIALATKAVAKSHPGDQADGDSHIDELKTELSGQYVFARLSGAVIKALVAIDLDAARKLAAKANKDLPQDIKEASGRDGQAIAHAVKAAPKVEPSRFRTIFRIWPDFDVQSCINRSISTVKADAAHRSFSALGEGITWAVMDTGIDGLHPHFTKHSNIDIASPLHADFTGSASGSKPLQDEFGHGTHVAGIIAGEGSDPEKMVAVWHELDEQGYKVSRSVPLQAVGGMAPKCKLISLKVLDEFGMGKASSVIAAISHVQLINSYGRDLKIHGVNLSLGHSFDPKWFACGRSPLCVEVNRLVKSGVVVVVAAGNTGYGSVQTKEGSSDVCLDLTINDPGNAEFAITVGSTHRDMPHIYGVSYFSSKGPTGDGRSKPDLVAPGENIVSCAAANSRLVRNETKDKGFSYFKSSGTSMAAPHVSGAAAAFLSIRNEYIGEAEKVKQIFTSTATDLGRDRYFQGAGLVDLMRAIQSV